MPLGMSSQDARGDVKRGHQPLFLDVAQVEERGTIDHAMIAQRPGRGVF